MLSLAWFNAKTKSNESAHFILVLIGVWHIKGSVEPVQMCWFGRAIAAPIHKKRCRLRLRPEFSPTMSALAHIWYKYQKLSVVQNLQLSNYNYDKNHLFVCKWNWYFCYCQIINLWLDIQYLVYYIIQNTDKTNDRRKTAKSISDIYNDILHNVKQMNSFGGYFWMKMWNKLPSDILEHLKSILN